MSIAAALALYAALGTSAWWLAGTAGIVAALVAVIAIEKRLATLRTLDPDLHHRQRRRAHR
ncbi:MAG TPA: hypothetical protein VFK43_08730 [Acidimicrobiales bacterium]|nr:hypothetical protein [Acidimicrobiales bacterium]